MADTKFSSLDPVVALDGTEILAVSKDVAGTSTSQRTTAQAIADLATNSGPTAVTALSIASGVVGIDCSLGQDFTLALTANVTSITFSNLAGAGFSSEIEVQITQDATGGRTLALPASFKALGGSDTAIASAANAVTVLSAKTFDNGSTWRYAMQESG
ncbi:hypothetical protein [Lysobacter sp. F6437]|uniref:hypothetical protein n=1 Tax=Lysobacter sp. F6437 TaxID=3459296 RepID=UPI00403D95D6